MNNIYVADISAGAKKQQSAANNWDVYFEEIFDRAGIRGEGIHAQEEIDYNGLRTLFLGECAWDFEEERFKSWLNDGGTVFCFCTDGVGRLMGFASETEYKQTDDEYSISAYVSLTEEYQREYQNREFKTLPVYSDCRLVTLEESCPENTVGEEGIYKTEVLAVLHKPTIFGLDGGDCLNAPAVCRRNFGGGTVYYFAFRLTQTICVMRQGRPVDRDYDGDGYYRTADAIVLTRGHDLTVPYCDIYFDLLRDFLLKAGQPVIHTMPVGEDGIPIDFLLHYGGDDESSPDYQVQAAKIMKELELPYHVNLMLNQSGSFAVNLEQYRQLKADGTVPSIHFDFFRARTFYTKEEFDEQLNRYVEEFGEIPKVSVNHVLMATGWSEQARWSCERGIKADHTRVHKHLMPDYNPINTCGLAFGTSLPHYVYDDAVHQNKKLDFLYIPIVFFEPRIWPETEEADKAAIDRMLEQSFRYGGACDVFVHPIYLVKEPAVIRALEYIKQRVIDKNYHSMHVNNDYLCDWWFGRSRISIENMSREGNKLRFQTVSERPFAVTFRTVYDRYLENGKEKKAFPYDRFGQKLLLFPVGAGENIVEITVE